MKKSVTLNTFGPKKFSDLSIRPSNILKDHYGHILRFSLGPVRWWHVSTFRHVSPSDRIQCTLDLNQVPHTHMPGGPRLCFFTTTQQEISQHSKHKTLLLHAIKLRFNPQPSNKNYLDCYSISAELKFYN